MSALTPFLLPACLFLPTLAFGLWVWRAGRPYPGLLFNIHKLLALAAAVLAVLRLVPALSGPGLPAGLVALLILAGLSVLALFASGAWLSAARISPPVARLIHPLALLVLTASLAGVLVWLV